MNLKKYILCMYVILNIHALFSQSVSLDWAKKYNGVAENIVYSIALDSNKNLYSVGSFSGTVDFDPNGGVSNLTAAGNDFFVCKLDSLGNFVWAKKISSNNLYTAGEVFCAKTDAACNVYFMGYFKGTIDFDPGPGTYSLTAAVQDIFICKLNSSGDFIWAKSMAGISGGYGYGRSIFLDKRANVYSTGIFNGQVDFDPGIGSYVLGPSFGDIFISKLDSSGNFLWAKSIGGGDVDQGISITVDINSNVLTTGSFKGTVDFDPGPSLYNLSSANPQDIYINKLDSLGNFIWAKCFSGGGFYDIGRSVVTDSLGNVYSTGRFYGTVDFDPSPGTYSLSVSTDGVYVSKLDNLGNFVWAKCNGAGQAEGRSIALDAGGNVYTTGDFWGLTDFDPGPAMVNLEGNSNYSLFLSKLDNNGNFVTAKTFGKEAYSRSCGNEVIIDRQDNVYLGGYFSGPCDFDFNYGTYTLTTAGDYNSFVMKINPCTLPAPPFSTTPFANLVICPGETITLTATASNGIVNWNPPFGNYVTGDTLVTFIPSGYSVLTFSMETLGCDLSPNRSAITLTVNPSPTITVNNGSMCQGESYTITPGGALSYTYSSGTNVVSPSSTSTYTVSGVNGDGCESSTVVGVIVNDKPTITVNSGNICIGKSFTITPSGAATYTYSSGSPVVTPTTNSTYTITGTSYQGCPSTNSVISTVNVLPLPVVKITLKDTILCSGNSTTLTASGASYYIWDNGPTSSAITVNPMVTTNYVVTGTNSFGCSNSFTITQQVSPCLGIDEQDLQLEKIKTYPNPNSNFLVIETTEILDELKIEFFDFMGRSVLVDSFIQKKVIDISFLSAGPYFAIISRDKKSISHLKIIKQ